MTFWRLRSLLGPGRSTTCGARCVSKAGRDPDPTVAIIDSQSVKTLQRAARLRCGQADQGRKRHIATDTQGNLLTVVAHSTVFPTRGCHLVLIRLFILPAPPAQNLRQSATSRARHRLGKAMFGFLLEVVKRPTTSVRRLAQTLDRRAHLRVACMASRLSKDFEHSPSPRSDGFTSPQIHRARKLYPLPPEQVLGGSHRRRTMNKAIRESGTAQRRARGTGTVHDLLSNNARVPKWTNCRLV